jgi:hypothetical protein
MLKSRRSSTPSQKDKDKAPEKSGKKQQRSASTSVLKSGNGLVSML